LGSRETTGRVLERSGVPGRLTRPEDHSCSRASWRGWARHVSPLRQRRAVGRWRSPVGRPPVPIDHRRPPV